MAKQKPWNQYEAVILLEAYVQVYEGKIDRKKAISEVSRILRRRVQAEGCEIDDIFRNVAGITFQMYSMESAFHGQTIRKPATKLFVEIVRLRENNKEQYDNILKSARKMIAIDSRTEYQNWLMNTGMKNTAARNYGNWLNNIDSYALKSGYSEKSVYEYDSASELVELYEKLSVDTEVAARYRDYLTSFRKYITYKSNGAIKIGKRSSDLIITVKPEKILKNLAEEVFLSEEESFRYSQILNEFFVDGLVLNAIRLDKFRMIYENEFNSEISQDDAELTSKLKKVGTYADGRIYPRHREEQSSLLDDIRKEILDVFHNGASCIFISCVMDRWRQPLSNQLNIYNETALRDIVMAEHVPGVYATNTVFKMAQLQADPEKDILELMKSSHTPLDYSSLQEKLWFIPIDTIKHTLVTTLSLVQVAGETYMYAPNFPVTSAELQHLVNVMKTKINDKGFLVSKDIAQLIHEKCPTIAINTEGYKDWAYRNVLKYILKDEFEFGGSVISEKGKKLEMRQVYRSFCRNYEHLVLSDLKQFSSDVGVQIYWEDVLSEMVRISENELVRKDLIHFDVDATDKILNELCPGDYIPINQVGLFLHFPTIDYPWNSYVLESYLRYSKKFELYHVSYSEKGVFGLVVRRNSPFQDYRQVVIDLLANSNEWDNEKDALSLIVEKGCQARKRLTGFGKIVQEAVARRENIFKERK